MTTAAYSPTRPSYIKLLAPYQKHFQPINPIPSREVVMDQMPVGNSPLSVPDLYEVRDLAAPKVTMVYQMVATVEGEEHFGTRFYVYDEAVAEYQEESVRIKEAGITATWELRVASFRRLQ